MTKRKKIIGKKGESKRPDLKTVLGATKDLTKDNKPNRKNIAKGEKLTTALTTEHKTKLRELAYIQNKRIADVLEDALNHYFASEKVKGFEKK